MSSLQRFALSSTTIFSSINLTQHHQRSHLKMVMNGKTSSKKAAQLLSPAGAEELFSSVDAFVFDCDGVLWKGSKLIDGVTQTLELLNSKGKKFVFVSNNSTKSRSQFIQKFRSFGIPATEDELLCSSFAASMYLDSIQFPKDKKVYVVGEQGLVDELELAGYTCLGGPEDGKKAVELKANALFKHDKSVGAVVVGMDQYINYYKLMYATLCIRENPGCLFIATELDPLVHMTDFQEWPVTGAMVAAIGASAQKEPIVVGKPSAFLMEFLLNKLRCDPLRMCVVGDRLDTDILFGQEAGCKTLLVLTGVTNESTLEDPSNEIQPDYYTSKVSDVLELVSSLSPYKRRCVSVLCQDPDEEDSFGSGPDLSAELQSSSHKMTAPTKPSSSASREPSPSTDTSIRRKMRSHDDKLSLAIKVKSEAKSSLTPSKRPASLPPQTIDLEDEGPKDLLSTFAGLYSPTTKKLYQHHSSTTTLNHAGSTLWKAFQEVLAASDRLKGERDGLEEKDRRVSTVLADSAKKIKDLQVALAAQSARVDELDGELQASSAKLETSETRVKTLSAEMLDMGAYYQMKARLDMMQQFKDGKHSDWDLDQETANFERCFPPGSAAPGASLLMDEVDAEGSLDHMGEDLTVTEATNSNDVAAKSFDDPTN